MGKEQNTREITCAPRCPQNYGFTAVLSSICHKLLGERYHPNAHKYKTALFLFEEAKMQSMLSLRATHGVPLCLSGIVHPLALSHEMADHDRRRQAMRRQRSLAREREGLHANQQMGTQRNFGRDFVEVKGDADGDLDDILHDLSHCLLGLTAKAA